MQRVELQKQVLFVKIMLNFSFLSTMFITNKMPHYAHDYAYLERSKMGLFLAITNAVVAAFTQKCPPKTHNLPFIAIYNILVGQYTKHSRNCY